MATKTKLTSGRYRVQFRKSKYKLISKTFALEADADAFERTIQSQINQIEDSLKSGVPVDWCRLYDSLHEELKKAVRLLPVFAEVLGDLNISGLTLRDLCDQFMLQYKRKDKNIIKRLGWWCDQFGKVSLRDFNSTHVRMGINHLLEFGASGKKGVAPQTTNRFKANLSSVFEFGKEKYDLKSNPCREVKSKPEGKGRERYLNQIEQERLLEAAKASRWDKFYLLVLMALTTGARLGELSKLCWTDVNFDEGTVTFRDTKNGTDRTVPLLAGALSELKRFRCVGKQLVFTKNNPNRAYDFRNEWYEALDKAGIARVTDQGEIVFHSLRHTFCSSLARQSKPLQEIATLAGHKSLQTTMRYTHLDVERKREAVEDAFGELFSMN